MDRATFLYDFGSLALWFSILALLAFFIQRKEDLETYRRIHMRNRLPLRELYIKPIRKLLIYLLVAVVLAFVVTAISSALNLF
jgi:hypothetical protein